MLIDLHTHTFPRSDDSFLTPEALIDRAKRASLDGICLTDHDGFWDGEDVECLSKRHNFPIFPGCEVTTEEGHLLVFGLDRYVFGMHKALLVKDLVYKAGGAIVVSHPYRGRYVAEWASDPERYSKMVVQASKDSVFLLADAVEVCNGRGSAQENLFSQEVARMLGMNGTGGSDAHKVEDVGTFATEFAKRVRTLDELVEELRAGRFRAVSLKSRQES